MVKVTRKDKGLRKLVAAMVGQAERVVATVGVLEKDASNTYPDGTTTGQVAVWNHFGTDTIPARPFISGPIEGQQTEIRALQARLAKGVFEGKLEIPQALEFIGRDLTSRIQKGIVDGIPPPNAPSTIAQKKSSKPLIDTSQLLQSISYEVREE